MRFYRGVHKHYCGIDLHARTMYLCLLDHEGTVLLHERVPSEPDAFLATDSSAPDPLLRSDSTSSSTVRPC
jgi:hypothetical protein